jgi:hypothetical protein
MKIHAGYEISYDCPQPTPMILTLSVHPSRVPDLLTPDRVRLDPAVPANTYHDSFGNFCHVIRAPAGRLTISTGFLVQDSGEPDAKAPLAQQHELEDLPVDVLIYLLGSRYCETDRLSNTAWSLRPNARTCGGRVDEDVVHPHPSQTRMCEFPASGSSWKSLAHVSVLMDDPDCRQRVTLENCIEPAPQEPASAIPLRQPFLPDPPDLIGVPA